MSSDSSLLLNPSMKDLTVVTLPATLKLTTSNYLAWKTQVEALLYGLDLFKFIDGSHPTPKPTTAADGSETPHKDYLPWFRQDRLLFGALVGSLSPQIVPLITGAASSHEAWQILAKTYASPSRGHIKQLKHRLKQTTKTPTQSITEYMQQIKTITDELASLGKKMDDEDVIDAILTGLDQSSYKPILDAIHARDTLISFNELHEKLINHELSIAQQITVPSLHQPASVFHLQQSNRGGPGNKQWTQKSHTASTGNNHIHHRQSMNTSGILPTPTTPVGNKPFLGKCQWCYQRGHSLTNCPVFKKVHPSIPIPAFNRNIQANKAQVNTMNLNNVPEYTNWIFDSGASHHVTIDLSNLSFHAPYDGTEELDRATKTQILKGTAVKGMYELRSRHLPSSPTVFTMHLTNSTTWHHRLGHPHNKVFKLLSSLVSFHSNTTHDHFLPHPHGLLLSQKKYISDIINKANMSYCKPITTPITCSETLTLHGAPTYPSPTDYRSIVGALQYLSLTRPDIAFTVNKLSQFMHAPTHQHWTTLKRLLRYLQGTLSKGLLLRKNSPLHLHAFTDADWAGDKDNYRNTTGYVVFLGSNPIAWSSKRQTTLARSSTEAEFRAVASTTTEVQWLTNLLSELNFKLPLVPAIYCDNLSATTYFANPVFHSRMKHLALDFHFVREKVQNGSLRVLTKPLLRPRFQLLVSKIVRAYFGLRATSLMNGPRTTEPGLEGESCCVCLMSLEKAIDDEKRVLGCGHEFHRACVDKWFDICRKTCPVCRFPVEVEEVKSKKSEELTEEMVIWFSSFHVAGYI
ncbi:hypothetical protein OSB04_006978 [Centaurea solstitialis]|uniref:RING-type domain-containing protein n=1 Tax=Centaurea solstitialis TaxID=347529 RepID=A0AA38U3J3_9ASTR|nr:hypothetical protein OSB04_006978 [Centaurea solstitialis]